MALLTELDLGKTILASVIIQELLPDGTSQTNFFYCKQGDPERSTCTSILKGLLNQLVAQSRDLVPYCYDRYQASGEVTLKSGDPAKRLLELLWQRISKQFIIIDGLDECSLMERKSVLSFFTSLVDKVDAKEPGKLRVLFVSQDENDIKKALSTATSIALMPSDNANDIKLFVRSWSIHIRQKFELDNAQIEYVIDLTCARAHGMGSLPSSTTAWLKLIHRHVLVCEASDDESVSTNYASGIFKRDRSGPIP